MRSEVPKALEQGRLLEGELSSVPEDGFNGFFYIFGPHGLPMKVIANTGDIEGADGWEHVSISTAHRNPTWDEMTYVKNLCWEEEETVVQLHVPKSQHISNHPYCLHLWRNVNHPQPLPPSIMVGIKAVGQIRDQEHAREVRKAMDEGKLPAK